MFDFVLTFYVGEKNLTSHIQYNTLSHPTYPALLSSQTQEVRAEQWI